MLHRAVELSDDVLHGEHHTEGHLALDYRGRSQDGDQDVLHLIDRDTACLLHLLEIEALQVDLKEVCLYILPLPALALLAPLELDLLHPVDKLIGDIPITTCLTATSRGRFANTEKRYPLLAKVVKLPLLVTIRM